MSKPVLLLVTASDCGACHGYIPFWEKDVFPTLNELKGIRIERLKMLNMGSLPSVMILSNETTVETPRDLSKFLRWYPMLIVITGETWDAALIDKNAKLRGAPFNGVFVEGEGAIPISNKVAMNAENIMSWMKGHNIAFSIPSPPMPYSPPAEEKKQSIDVVPSEDGYRFVEHVGTKPRGTVVSAKIQPR